MTRLCRCAGASALAVRMEWSPKGAFEDRRTMAVWNRVVDPPAQFSLTRVRPSGVGREWVTVLGRACDCALSSNALLRGFL